MSFTLDVEYDDGTQTQVVAGQREMADWEGQPFGCATTDAMALKPMAFLRFLAWSVLRRQGERRSYSVWSDNVVSVFPVDDGDDESEAAPVPTGAGQSDET